MVSLIFPRSLATFALIWLVATATGCATTQHKQASTQANAKHFAALKTINTFTLKARIGIQMPRRGYSGALTWQHQGKQTDDITVYSPLGSQVASISQTANHAKLTNQKGQTFEANSAAQLIKTHLGWTLPVEQLNHWLLANPQTRNTGITGITGIKQFDAQGRLTMLTQQGWTIQYKQYSNWNGIDLPSKVFIKSKDFSLKLIANDWQFTQH